jgi:hypothetical protein
MEGVRLIAVLVTADELEQLQAMQRELGLENLGHAFRVCLQRCKVADELEAKMLEEQMPSTPKPKKKVATKQRDGMGSKRRTLRSQLDIWRRQQND